VKKLLALSAPLLAAVALVAAPAAARAAEPVSWYAGGRLLAEGEPLPVTVEGTDSIYAFSFGFRATCHQSGTGTVENLGGQALESVTSATFGSCRVETGGERLRKKECPKGTKPEIAAEGLPWSGKVNEDLDASYEGVQLRISCSGEDSELLTGSISGFVTVNGLAFGEQQFGSNFLEPDSLFTGVWHLRGPEHRRAITAILGTGLI